MRRYVRTVVAASVTATVSAAVGPAVGAAPAAAGSGSSVYPSLDCIQPGNDGTYRAVFGYRAKVDTTVAIGPDNTMNPSSLNGIQPTSFPAGNNKAVFATPPVPDSQPVSWTVLGQTATATSSSNNCGPSVSLPAEGNGIGPVLVIVSSVLLSLLSLGWREWRQRRRAA